MLLKRKSPVRYQWQPQREFWWSTWRDICTIWIDSAIKQEQISRCLSLRLWGPQGLHLSFEALMLCKIKTQHFLFQKHKDPVPVKLLLVLKDSLSLTLRIPAELFKAWF